MKPAPGPNATHRYRALDSIRGIAAAIVVLSHFCDLAPFFFLRRTPMRLILGGHESVLTFFVLSGFVLALQIRSNKQKFVYGAYAAQRVLRIYPPYFVAFLAGLACFTIAHQYPAAWAGNWFNGAWQAPLPPDVIGGHLALVLPFNTGVLVPVFWTLLYEMRVSLILPLCVYLASKTTPQVTLVTAIALSGLSCLGVSAGQNTLIEASLVGAWVPTLHYAALFMIGVTLALHRDEAVAFIRRHNASKWLLLGGLVFFFSGSPIGFRLHSILGDFLYDWIVSLGAGAIILSVLADETFAQRLTHRVWTFFGDISYSLYLLHTVVLLTVVHLIGDRIPHLATIALALVLAVPVAYLSYRCVEVPAIFWGRRAASVIRERLTSVRK